MTWDDRLFFAFMFTAIAGIAAMLVLFVALVSLFLSGACSA